jgi:KDO2-lipid IV(A) lauroyltransferase
MSRRILNYPVRLALKLGWLVSFLPLKAQRGLGRLLGAGLYYLAAPRRFVVQKNLELCFSATDSAYRRRLAKQFFRNVGIAFIDLFWLWRVDIETLIRRVEIKNIDIFLHAKSLRSAKGKSLIVFAPHFLGLDAGGARLQLEDRLVCMYSKQAITAIDEWIFKGRGRFNQPMLVSRSEGIARLARAVRQGVTAHFSPDMDLGPQGAVFSPFFGVISATQPSLIRLAHLTDAIVVPMVTRITETGYSIEFFENLEFPKEEPLERGVQRVHQFLEDRIRETPDQYLWAHRRFKTRPSGEAAVYPPKKRR